MSVSSGYEHAFARGAVANQGAVDTWEEEVFGAPKVDNGELFFTNTDDSFTQTEADRPADKGDNVPAKTADQRATDKPREASENKEEGKPDKAVAIPFDGTAQYIPASLSKTVEALLATKPDDVRKALIEKLKTEKSNSERIKIIEALVNGKLDEASRQQIVAPESSPERLKVLEQMLANEREIESRYRIMREVVVKTLPDFREFFMSGERDQQRQSVYFTLIKQDGKANYDDLKQLLSLESDPEKQKQINALLDSDGVIDRSALLKGLRDGEKDVRKIQLIEQVAKREDSINVFAALIAREPSEESIKSLGLLLKDENQRKRIDDLLKSTSQSRINTIDQILSKTDNADLKAELERLKKEESREVRLKILAKIESINDGVISSTMIHQLVEYERKLAILADLPKEEQRRFDVFQALKKCETGDYDAIMRVYPLCAEWLKNIVPEAYIEIGYNMGMAIPPGCPMKLPTNEGRPLPPRLMELYAADGMIKFDMESDPSKLLDPAEKIDAVAILKNATDWVYTVRAEVHDKQLKYTRDNFLAGLRQQHFGYEGTQKFGPDGIPKGWMPPDNIEDVNGWCGRVTQVVNLANRIRNYTMAMKTIDGIQSSEAGLKELEAIGVQFEFKNGRLTSFCIPDLEDLDLRLQIPTNSAKIARLEAWLAKYHKDVDKALDPYKVAVDKLIEKKDAGAFLRHGDFAFDETIHPKVGFDYHVIKQRVTSVQQKGGNIIIEGTLEYQTAEKYSYNYWFGCKSLECKMNPTGFRKLNGLADGAEPKVGEKYKIIGSDGQAYENWTFVGTDKDGSFNFKRDEKFRIEVPANDYVPALTAMGTVELVKGYDVQRWLYGFKVGLSDPRKWELPQVGFWHHGVKWGKAVMDVGLTFSGGYGVLRGGSIGARAMSLGRGLVGLSGLGHAWIDHHTSKEMRDSIRLLSHSFILFDTAFGLGLPVLKKSFGFGTAARESASLLKDAGHLLLAVDGIGIYGPMVATQIKNMVENHLGLTNKQILDRAIEDRATPARISDRAEPEDKPAKFDLADKATRDSIEVMIERLCKTVLTETKDADARLRVEKMLETFKEVSALDRNDPKRKQFLAELSKLFSESDASIVWRDLAPAADRLEVNFRKSIQIKAQELGRIPTPQERMVAASIALILEANEKGEFPDKILKREVVIPERKVRSSTKKDEWDTVKESKKEISVSKDYVIRFIQSTAETSDLHSLKMGAAKMLWRMKKLDNNGLAGVLLDVAKNSSDRDLVGMALIDSKDVSLAYLLNDIMHDEVLIARGGYGALRSYREKYYGLTSDALKRELKQVMTDDKYSPDVRGLTMEILLANDLDKVKDRKSALEECDKRWQGQKGKDGSYVSSLLKSVNFQALQDVPKNDEVREIKIMEDGVEKTNKVTRRPDDVRLEKFKALISLQELGTIKVDGANFKLTPEVLNANLLKCLSKSDLPFSVAVFQKLDIAKLSLDERRTVLGMLGWPSSFESEQLKSEILKRIKAITNGDVDLMRETKQHLLDMLNPGNRPVPGATDGDYSFVAPYPGLHAATITALAEFGCQYLHYGDKVEMMKLADFEKNLDAGQDGKLVIGKYYQIKTNDGVTWYRYMGSAEGQLRMIKQGDPTVATLIRHFQQADRIGSAKVRLAVVQAAADLKIPGLRLLLIDAIKKETDPRVARRLREVRMPEEPPLDPASEESIKRIEDFRIHFRENMKIKELDSYGKWLYEKYPLLFERKFQADLEADIKKVYGTTFIWSDLKAGFDQTVSSGVSNEDKKLLTETDKDPLADPKFPELLEKLEKSGKAQDKQLAQGLRFLKIYDEEVEKVIKEAKDGSDEAILALAWIITTRGGGAAESKNEPLAYPRKNVTIAKACLAFLELAKEGSPKRGSTVKWAIELLVQNGSLPPDQRGVFVDAAKLLATGDKSKDKDQAMTQERFAKVLFMAILAPGGLPEKGSDKYKREIEFRKSAIMELAECRDPQTVELFEAIATEFKKTAPELSQAASDAVRWLRDGIQRNITDARKKMDTTASASARKEAIIVNLTDPTKSEEEVVTGIAKATEGYEWNQKGNDAQDEILWDGVRRALNDPRVRVRMMASIVMLYKSPHKLDKALACSALLEIKDTPYRYAIGDRKMEYFKIEAQQILDMYDKDVAKAPDYYKDAVRPMLDEGKRFQKLKSDGSVHVYSVFHMDPSKSLATAQSELESALRTETNDVAIVKAIFIALDKHNGRPTQPSDPVFDLYRKALEHKSEKVRFAAAIALIMTTTSEVDLNRAIAVTKAIAENGSTEQIKLEAMQELLRISRLRRFSVGGMLSAREAALPAPNRPEAAKYLDTLIKEMRDENQELTVGVILALKLPSGTMKADDPALPALRKALTNDKIPIAIRFAAAMVMAEQSPIEQDVKDSVNFFAAVRSSQKHSWRYRNDAEQFLKFLESDSSKAALIPRAQR